MSRRSVGLLSVVLFGAVAVRAAGTQAPAPAAPTAPSPTAATAAAAAVPTGPAPHIKFDKVEINLGDVVRGEDAVAVFTYQNTGSVPLHILSAKPG
jgi:hypothetical protein